MRKLLLFAALASAARARTADRWQELVVAALHAAGDADFTRAERLFNEAIHEAEFFGANDSRLGATWNNLGLVYRREGKRRASENAYRRASTIFERLDPKGMDAGNVALNLGLVLMDEFRYSAAEPLLQKALNIFDARFGSTSAKAAIACFNLGEAFRYEAKFEPAEAMLKRAADINEANFGMASSELAATLQSRALNFTANGDYRRAGPMFKLALSIWDTLPETHAAERIATRNGYAEMLRAAARVR